MVTTVYVTLSCDTRILLLITVVISASISATRAQASYTCTAADTTSVSEEYDTMLHQRHRSSEETTVKIVSVTKKLAFTKETYHS